MIIYRLLIILLSIVILSNCANPRYPTGGPVDKIPPKIVETYPENETVNYSENFIAFSFSEYVDKSSFRDALFFSPSIDGEIEYNWSGKDVEVIFHDGLKENTTYSISVGTDVKDINNNNKMLNTNELSFSTGDKIDKGIVAGKVYGNNYSGAMIFAYKNFADTLNPSKTKPDYVSQVSTDGSFKLLGLSEGDYRIIAVKDEFKDLLYQKEEDLFGCFESDLILEVNDTSNSNLRFMLTREDTSKPQISEATMIDKNHIIVKFTENLDSSKITASQFSIIDTINNRQLKPEYYYRGKTGDEFTLIISDTLTEGNEYIFNSSGVFDLTGNKSNNENISFVASQRKDTTKVKLTKKITALENSEIDNLDSYVILQFNDAIPNLNWDEVIQIKKGNNYFNLVGFEKEDDARILIKFNGKVRLKEKFNFEINSDKISDIAGNKCDSIKSFELKVTDGLNFSGASGSINSDKINLIAVLYDVENKRNYETKVDKNKFNFERVSPGKYLFWVFSDLDSNQTYNYGSVFPYKKSEEFVFLKDTLELKARWPVGDIEINF